MKVIKMEVGHLGTNCYIAYCEKTNEAAIIDPGGNGEELAALLQRENLTLRYIINTHGHADHIGANSYLKERTQALIAIHELDADMLSSAQRNLSIYIGSGITSQAADCLLKDGDTIEVGEMQFTVLHTPGHTPGGISLLCDGILFSGDTLFYQSVGRSDFPGGSHSQLIRSIQEKLLILPDDTKVLPGHGPDSTIGDERAMNPFIQ